MELTCTAQLLLIGQLSRYINQSLPLSKRTYSLHNTVRTSSYFSAHQISNIFLVKSPLKLIKVLQQHLAKHLLVC